MQVDGAKGLTRSSGEQRVFYPHGTRHRPRHRLKQAQLLHEKRGQGCMRQVSRVNSIGAPTRLALWCIRLYPQVERPTLYAIMFVVGNPGSMDNVHRVLLE